MWIQSPIEFSLREPEPKKLKFKSSISDKGDIIFKPWENVEATMEKFWNRIYEYKSIWIINIEDVIIFRYYK